MKIFPDDIVRSQIDALNRDYNLVNEDTVNLRPFLNHFKNARIKFELATKTPSGAPKRHYTNQRAIRQFNRLVAIE